MVTRAPTPVDVELGRRFHKARMALGAPLEEIAQAVGLRYQQVRKYELGKSRFAVGIMLRFSIALDMPCDELAKELKALAKLLPNPPKPLRPKERKGKK